MDSKILHDGVYYKEFIRLVTHNLPDMLWIKDIEGTYIYANEALCSGLLMAKDINEPIGKNDIFFALREREKHKDREDWHTFGELCFNSDLVVIENNKPMKFIEYGNVKGELLYLEVHKAPFYDDQGNIIGTIGVGRDITELKKTQNELQEQAFIVQQSNDAFISTDMEGTILSWNPSATKIFSYEENEILGKSIAILYGKNGKKSLSHSLELLKYQDEIRSKIQLQTKKNETKIIEQTISKLIQDNSVKSILFIYKDITFREKLTQEISQQEKIIYDQAHHASIGQMIGNIAHQWRQPLSIITTSASGLMVRSEFQTLTHEDLMQTSETIVKTAKYLSNTISDFQNFIKGDRNFLTFNLSDTIESCITLQAPSLLDNHIDVVKKLDDSIEIKGYPNELIQCFMNMFSNSKDQCIINNIDTKDRFIFITTYKKEDKVCIEVSDSAGGAEDNVVKRLFEQYFTTKANENGTGLGLNMTYNLIVKGMGGSIVAKNSKNIHNNKSYTGLTFHIELPSID